MLHPARTHHRGEEKSQQNAKDVGLQVDPFGALPVDSALRDFNRAGETAETQRPQPGLSPVRAQEQWKNGGDREGGDMKDQMDGGSTVRGTKA